MHGDAQDMAPTQHIQLQRCPPKMPSQGCDCPGGSSGFPMRPSIHLTPSHPRPWDAAGDGTLAGLVGSPPLSCCAQSSGLLLPAKRSCFSAGLRDPLQESLHEPPAQPEEPNPGAPRDSGGGSARRAVGPGRPQTCAPRPGRTSLRRPLQFRRPHPQAARPPGCGSALLAGDGSTRRSPEPRSARRGSWGGGRDPAGRRAGREPRGPPEEKSSK